MNFSANLVFSRMFEPTQSAMISFAAQKFSCKLIHCSNIVDPDISNVLARAQIVDHKLEFYTTLRASLNYLQDFESGVLS